MKRFSCGSVVPGCTATFAAPTVEGILDQVAAHAQEAHGLSTVPPELVDAVRLNVVAA